MTAGFLRSPPYSIERFQLHAHVREFARNEDLHGRRRLVAGQPEIQVPLPAFAVRHVDAPDRELQDVDLLAVESPPLDTLGDDDDRVDLAVRPDLHPPCLLWRVAPDGVDPGRDVEHAVDGDVVALRLGLAAPGVRAPGADGLQGV